MKKVLLILTLIILNSCSLLVQQPIDDYQTLKYLKQNFPTEYKLLQENKIVIDIIQPDINYIEYHYL